MAGALHQLYLMWGQKCTPPSSSSSSRASCSTLTAGPVLTPLLFAPHVSRTYGASASPEHLQQDNNQEVAAAEVVPCPEGGDTFEPASNIAALRACEYTRSFKELQKKHIYNDKILRNHMLAPKRVPLVKLKQRVSRPPMPLCCCQCVPDSRESFRSTGGRPRPGLEVHDVLRVPQQGSWLARRFRHVLKCLNLIQFPYPRIFSSVLVSERVQEAIVKAAVLEAREEGVEVNESETDPKLQPFLQRHRSRAVVILNIMSSKLSDYMLRLTSWVLYKLLPIFVSKVVVHPEQIAMLQRAAEANKPMIFLPDHRSHLDYILMSFILLNNGVKAPLVAAGDNLKIPVFGFLLRGLGAFYIKRKIDPETGHRDLVYRAVLHTYMVEILRAGHYIEFYIEGGRTRTGKTCMPKGGLLSVIVDTLKESVVEDTLIVPVSINYERLVDGNFIHEQLGSPKVMETFRMAVSAIWHALNSSYGTMSVGFSQPFSLKEFMTKYEESVRPPSALVEQLPGPGKGPMDVALSSRRVQEQPGRPPSSVSLYGIGYAADEQRNVVDTIARHVIYDCCEGMSLMTTNVVAFLLLMKFREGASLDELVAAITELAIDVREAKRTFGFTGDYVDVVHQAVHLLGPGMVRRERVTSAGGGSDTILIKPVTMLPNVIELSYYANGVLDLYKLDAVVATAACSLLRESGGEGIDCDELVTSARDICSIMQFEFIFTKPCSSLDQALYETIDKFLAAGYLVEKNAKPQPLKIPDEEEAENGVEYRRKIFLPDVDDSEDSDGSSNGPLLYKLNPAHLERVRLLVHTLRPLMEGYAGCCYALPHLVGRQLQEAEFLKIVTAEIQRRLDSGEFLFNESLCLDPIRNALRVLEKLEIVECHRVERLKLYYLHQNYEDDEYLQNAQDKFASFVCTVDD